MLPHRAAREIKRDHPTFSLQMIRWDDPAAFNLLKSGDVEGIHQFHDSGLHQNLSRLLPRSVVDIAAITAAYHVDVHLPRTQVEYLGPASESSARRMAHPAIAASLHETKGFILFQEQIMLLLKRLAGIPPAEGYRFIKAANKHRSDEVESFRERFVASATGTGISTADLAQLFQEIQTAATWAVCKSHFLAEAVLTYQATYLKARYRTYFDRALGDFSF